MVIPHSRIGAIDDDVDLMARVNITMITGNELMLHVVVSLLRQVKYYIRKQLC